MRTTFRIFGLALGLATLSAPIARAATVTRIFVSGNSANLNLVLAQPGSRPDCTVDLFVALTPAASVQRGTGTASTGAIGFVQRIDNCAETWEFGSINVALPSTAFSSGNGTASFTATIPLVMELISGGSPVNRTLGVNLQFTAIENNSDELRTFGMTRAPGFTFITRGKTVSNGASVAGQLTLDGGASLLTPQATIIASIDRSSSLNIDIIK